MDATDVVLDGPLAWLRLVGAAALYVAPGLVIALLWLPRRRYRPFLAPVLSMSLVGGCAIVLSMVGLPVGVGTTLGLAAFLTLALVGAGWRRWARVWAGRRPARHALREGLMLAGVLVVVAVAQSSVHFDEVDTSAVTAWPRLGWEATQAMKGAGSPYPVHMDEHLHMASTAAILRDGDGFAGRDANPDGITSSLEGLHALLFHVALAQIAAVTGAPLPFLWRFLPAVWSVVIAGSVYTATRGSPGALASAALVAALPTTVLILGPGFVVPIAFGLAWTVAVWALAAHGTSRWHLALLGGLVAAAVGIHLVAGMMSLLVACLTLLACRADRTARIAAITGLVVPFFAVVLLAPSAFDRVFEPSRLPWGSDSLASMGWLILPLAVLGAVASFLSGTGLGGAHRALVATSILVMAAIGLMALIGINSLIVFYRPQHTLFLCEALLAGAGIGVLVRWMGARIALRRAWQPTALAAVLLVVVSAPAIAGHLTMDRYQVFDDASWEAAQVAVDAGMGPEDMFLSHPWKAVFYHAMTGAVPYAHFRPALQAINQDGYDAYVASQGASQEALDRRGIAWILDPVAPNAANITHSPWVYEIIPAQG